jgi:hypothetical protein
MLVVMRAAIGSPLRGRGARGSELVIHPSCLQHRPQCRRNRARLMTERIHFHDVCAKERDMHSRALAAETAADARGSWDRARARFVSAVSLLARTTKVSFSQREMRGGCGSVRWRMRSCCRSSKISRSFSCSERRTTVMRSRRIEKMRPRTKNIMQGDAARIMPTAGLREGTSSQVEGDGKGLSQPQMGFPHTSRPREEGNLP